MSPTTVDPVDSDPLAARLHTLPLTTPARLTDAAALAAAVAEARGDAPRGPGWRRRRRVRRRSLAGALSFATLVAANGGAAYYAPVYGHLLAGAPLLGLVSGPALAAAGLSASDVSPMHDSATDHGITATLVGGYADGLRTTLLVDIEGVRPGFDQPSLRHGCALTDQFGQAYTIIGGEGIDVGAYPIDFQPLRGAAARVGARLTVTCEVFVGFKSAGALHLHATLLPGSVRSLPVPAAVDSNGSHYAVLRLRSTTNALEVHTRITGAIIDAGLRGGNYTYPGVFLVTPSGRWLIPFADDSTNIEAVLETQHALDETRVFSPQGQGTYRIVVSHDTPGPSAQVLAEWTITLP